MHKCITETKGVVTCKDKSAPCRFRVKNKRRRKLLKYEIDGCLVNDDEVFKRCDFGVQSGEVFWLIELKGTDFKDAVEQIISTLVNTSFIPDNLSITPVIVSTKAPAVTRKERYLKRLRVGLGDRWSGRIELGTGTLQVE